MSANPQDPDYDPERWLVDWKPSEPERTITCDCGASLILRHLFNKCPNCGAHWDRWAHLVLAGKPAKP